MEHLVIIVDEVMSKRLSAVEMARRLRDAGFSITLIGRGGDYQEIDNFDYIRIELKDDAAAPATSNKSANGDKVPGSLQHWREIIESLSPDLLLIDIEAHAFVLAALASTHPVALFSVFFNLKKQRSMPPLHFDIVPGRGLSGTPFMIELAWLRFRLSKFISNKREKLRRGGRDRISKLRDYAHSLGLELTDHVDCYQWLIPFVYRSLPLLVLNPSEMEFPFRPDRSVFYVGPMICNVRDNLDFLPEKAKLETDIQTLLDSHRQGRNDRRLVYCSFGCFFGGNDQSFWEKLIEAFRDTEWDVIFALGNRLHPESFQETPENIYLLGFAPQLDILEMADCAVIHAGMTTVYECLLCEVPMVTYPFRVNDQMGTAARVVYHRIGLRGRREKDSPAEIRELVERAMNDRTLKENIQRLRRHTETYRETSAVAEAVRRIIRETL